MAERKPKPRALTIAELERVNYSTGLNARNLADRVATLVIIATDAEADRRRKENQCAACAYLGRNRISGQAFTSWNCQLCKEPQPSHPNTGVPRLCGGCAEAYGLCVSCGGDLEMRTRGRLTGRRAQKAKSR